LGSRDVFGALPSGEHQAIVGSSSPLVLFPPDDTASNLNPGDPTTPGLPQLGHGSVKPGALFNDPSDPE